MRVSRNKFLLCALLASAFAFLALPAPAQNARLELKNLEKLKSKASEMNDISLDGGMLQMAIKVLSMSKDPDALRVRDAVKGLQGIYVKNFTFDQPNAYSQEDVEAIRSQLSGPGWSRVVASRSKHEQETDEIYVMKDGDKVAGVAILVAEAKELSIVNLVGLIDIEKLGELGGEFGIPTNAKPHAGSK